MKKTKNSSQNIKKVTTKMVKRILPKRTRDCHKGCFGYVGVMGGSANYSGAPALAANGLCALRQGAGVSRVIVPTQIADTVRNFAPEPTVFCVDGVGDLPNATKGLKALSVGMGWARTPDRVDMLRWLLLEFGGTLILDADALYALKYIDKQLLKTSKAKVIITPHMGEFCTLLDIDKTEVMADPINIVKQYALENNIIVLLKGATTIISNGVDVYLSATGSVGMATAGSGDVLSGIMAGLGGFLSPIDVAVVGAFVNGLAGERASKKFGEYSMISSDTIKEIAYVIKSLTK